MAMWATAFRLVKHERKPVNYSLGPQFHRGFELLFVDYGELKVTLNRQTHCLGTEEGLIIPPHARHSFAGPMNRSVQFLNIIFFGQCPRSIVSKPIRMRPEDRRIMRDICDELQIQDRHAERLALIKLNELLVRLVRRDESLREPQRVDGENRLRHRERVVATALAHLESRFDRPLDFKATAQHAGVSPSHLRSLVRAVTGHGLGHHLIKMRLREAKRLLHESPESIKEVAFAVGYQSVAHFCNLFKKNVGMTPTEFARSLGAGTPVASNAQDNHRSAQ